MAPFVLIIGVLACLISGFLLVFGISKQLSSTSARMTAIIVGVVDIIIGLLLLCLVLFTHHIPL